MPDTVKVMIFCGIANQYNKSDLEQGIKYGGMALDLALKSGWQKGVALAYNELGICSYYKSDLPVTFDYWNKALRIFREIKDKGGILKIVGNMGVVKSQQGDYPGSIENDLEALKYAEELGDTQGIAINLGNLGTNFDYLKDYKKALDFDFKALAISEILRDTQNIALNFGNIGNIYGDLKNYPEAIKFQLASLKYNEYLDNAEGVARDKDNIGSLYSETGEYATALEYFLEALSLSSEKNIKPPRAIALFWIGETLMQMTPADVKKYATEAKAFPSTANFYISPSRAKILVSAIEFLQKSIEINIEQGDLNELQHCYYSLAKAQRELGEFREALESNDNYIKIKDSVFSLDSKVKIANLETKRELELKDKQIEIEKGAVALKDKQIEIDRLEVARKRNERVFFIAGIILLLGVIAIVIRNMRLAAAKELSENKLNAFQARMNPHFIFNSLSSIQSLVMNNENEASIDYLSEFATLMRQILDNSAKSKVPLKTEIEMLESYIQLEHLRFDCFKWEIRIAEDVKEKPVEIPGMIIQPFVENAILHGLSHRKGNGLLTINIERVNRQIICTVDDNGIGRAKSAELNKRRNKSRQSHGISIAVNRLTLLNDKKRGLVNKVEYVDKVENGIPAGTSVIIQIPIL